MSMYFLDSSAIVKRYFQEQGHEWVETLYDAAQGHGLYIAQAALVEKEVDLSIHSILFLKQNGNNE